MGYTHYWKFKKNPAELVNGKEKFIKAVELIKEGLKHLKDIELADGSAIENSKPIFSETEVWFNGKGNTGYESVAIMLDDPNDYNFNFCKTARQPYGVAVCLTLLCFKEAFGEDFSYSSDGRFDIEEGWTRAADVFKTIIEK